MYRRILRVSAVAALLAAGGCGDGTGPAAFAGTYHLIPAESSSAVTSGTFMLSNRGLAQRRVQYGSGPESLLNGTFEVVDGALIFHLKEPTASGEHVWTVSAVLVDGGFVFRYPSPADGPDTIETYRR